jgi:hypothetical protein
LYRAPWLHTTSTDALLRFFGLSAARGIQFVYGGQRKGPSCKQNSPSQKLSLKSANITSQLLSQRLQQVQQQRRLQQEQQRLQQEQQRLQQEQQRQRLLQQRQQLQQELLWLLQLLLWLLLQHLSKQPNRAKRQEREIQQFSSYGKPPSKTYENLTGTPQRMQ